MAFASVALFLYKRPIHAKNVLASLALNSYAKNTKLYIFIDGPKCEEEKSLVEETFKVSKEATGFASVELFKKSKNHGLARSVIEGVSTVIKKEGKVIVVEDDLMLSARFLEYMNNCLNAYEDVKKIFSISGYNYPSDKMVIPEKYQEDIYLSLRASSWGWATWKDRWEKIDWTMSGYEEFQANEQRKAEFALGGEDLPGMLAVQMDGRIDSWAIRFVYAQFLTKTYAIYPVKSLVSNEGFGEAATHCTGGDDRFRVELDDSWIPAQYPKDINFNEDISNNWQNIFKRKPGNKPSNKHDNEKLRKNSFSLKNQFKPIKRFVKKIRKSIF